MKAIAHATITRATTPARPACHLCHRLCLREFCLGGGALRSIPDTRGRSLPPESRLPPLLACFGVRAEGLAAGPPRGGAEVRGWDCPPQPALNPPFTGGPPSAPQIL